MVLVGGLTLFSDGYNAQIIGYMNPLLAQLYPGDFSKTIKTRISNAYLIGEIFGMLFFSWAIGKLGGGRASSLRRCSSFWALSFRRERTPRQI